MLDYFTAAKHGVLSTMERVLAGYAAGYANVSIDLGADAAARLSQFASRGKLLRGCLVRLGFELARGSAPEGREDEAVRLAGAAMELFQSGLLIHDDIMDRDRVRRGFPTLHVGYEETLQYGDYDDPVHYGEALGICAGDLAYFAAFGVLSELPVGQEKARQACAIASKELALVGIAQMQDVVNGAVRPRSRNTFREASTEPLEEDILKLYRYKTGRYTFSLPLAMGSAIAGSPESVRLDLEKSGENLGVLFQLKDDELGLFADEAELGKPVGADIREDKKTLFRLRLFGKAAPGQVSRLKGIFGAHDASAKDIAYVTELIDSLGIRGELVDMMRDYTVRAREPVAHLISAAPAAAARAFDELTTYSLERTS